MLESSGKTTPKLLFVIIDKDRCEEVAEIISDACIPLHFRTRAAGTASSEMLDLLGLGRTDKAVTTCLGPAAIIDDTLLELSAGLRLKRRGRGIAFTVPLAGISAPIYRLMDANMCQNIKIQTESEVSDMHPMPEFALILAVINRGYSEELMDAAREAGARGGTVVHARRMGDVEALKAWGISVQEERELVYIVARKQDQVDIMKAINKACGLRTEAQGFVLSLPVDAIEGIADTAE